MGARLHEDDGKDPADDSQAIRENTHFSPLFPFIFRITMYTKSLKTMLIVAVAAAVVAGILPPTYSTPTFSDIETGSGVFVAGELDLELDGNNPHSGPLIDIADAAAGATYHRDIELHLAGGSNPANTSLCFTKVQSASTGGNGGGEAGVVHTYGDDETEGSIGVERSGSDATTVTYVYEAASTCVKFEDPPMQLGEGDPDEPDCTVGMTDTFVVTMHGGCLPISGHLKWGNAAAPSTRPFTFTTVGQTVDIYHGSTLTYTITLTEKTGNTYTFAVTSIAKAGATALSHIEFCFSADCNGCLNDYIEIDLSITDPDTGVTHVLLSLNEHRNLSWLDGRCIPLTAPSGIPALQPCLTYVVNVSIHVNATTDEITGKGVAFTLSFHVEQARHDGAGLSDVETSDGNTVTAGGGGS